MIINLQFASSPGALIVAVLIPASCADPPPAASGPGATPEPGTATATPEVAALDAEPPADLVAPDREATVDLSEGGSARADSTQSLTSYLKFVESYEGGATSSLQLGIPFHDAPRRNRRTAAAAAQPVHGPRAPLWNASRKSRIVVS